MAFNLRKATFNALYRAPASSRKQSSERVKTLDTQDRKPSITFEEN